MNSLNSDAVTILKLVVDQLIIFDQIIRQLQAQVNELSSQMSISILTEQATSTDSEEVASITVTVTKSEKLSDSLMFNRD